MDIFISWSGERSRACADALKVWLPRIIQSLKPWVSTRDIGKGARWSNDIAKQLDHHAYGIICVTPENRHSTWLNFEAGALSKTDASRTYTLLLGLTHSEVEQPLAQFNHTLANKDDVLALVKSINQAAEYHLDEDLLLHGFELNWPFLEEVFAKQTAAGAPRGEKAPAARISEPRDEKSMIQEILELVRYQALPRGNSPAYYPNAGRMHLVRDLVSKAIERRPYKISFTLRRGSESHASLELSAGENTLRARVNLQDSIAEIENSVGFALDSFETMLKDQ